MKKNYGFQLGLVLGVLFVLGLGVSSITWAAENPAINCSSVSDEDAGNPAPQPPAPPQHNLPEDPATAETAQ